MLSWVRILAWRSQLYIVTSFYITEKYLLLSLYSHNCLIDLYTLYLYNTWQYALLCYRATGLMAYRKLYTTAPAIVFILVAYRDTQMFQGLQLFRWLLNAIYAQMNLPSSHWCINMIKERCKQVSNWWLIKSCIQMPLPLSDLWHEIKWMGFRPPLRSYRLNWARRTSWGRWDEWDDTALQTQYSMFEPWRSEAEHATSRSRRLPTILNLCEWAGKKHFISLKLEVKSGVRISDLWLPKQAALTTAPGIPPSLIT